MIIRWSSLRAVVLAGVAVFAASCDSGTPSRTRDDIAADSALASDLALANRYTTLVDSIGAYHPPDAAERDTAKADSAMITVVPPVAAKPTVVASAKVVTPTPKKIIAPAPAPAPAAPVTTPVPASLNNAVAAGRTRTGAAACDSPIPANQRECVRATLAAADGRLNRVYRALITETRRQERVAPGGGDPASVERLRVAQRAWLVYRDTECRKRGRGNEGALWARPRVKCLAEFSERRANELADDFSRLTAH
ncbi:MAG: lysozyme inhibitor LprI family protein [Thermoanaerobaculia bacterium]